jgi:ABC-type lipoprotein release transport system permease subunit
MFCVPSTSQVQRILMVVVVLVVMVVVVVVVVVRSFDKRRKSSTFFSANRHFSLGQPFPSSLPVLAPCSASHDSLVR